MGVRAMSVTNTDSSKRWPVWAFFPVGLLALLLTIQVVMVSLATDDPGFAVEENYYQRAVDWDQQAAQRATNQQLGWTVHWTATPHSEGTGRLAMKLKAADGSPITEARLELIAFPNSRSSQRQSLTARELEPGHYVASFVLSRLGLWEFRLAAHANGHKFTNVTQQDISQGGSVSN